MEANLRTSYSESDSDAEDYISMEVDDVAFYRHLHHRRSSSAKEFEFQSFSSSSDADHTTTSPADELFYMGKLLPLHLPPRLQMVNNILIHQNDDESFTTPLFTPTANTPYESCNISPAESCQVSRELNPEEYFLDYLSELQEKKPRAKAVKQSSGIGSKLKWGYFKSLFTKSSGCSNEYAAAAAAATASAGGRNKIRSLPKATKQNTNDTTPFGQISYNKEYNCIDGDHRRTGKGTHRRSFSGAFKKLSMPKPRSNSPSSSTIIASNSTADLNYRQIILKRSSTSIGSEMENPIQAAIAHCKRSHQESHSANHHEIGFFSGSSAIYENDRERASRLCRG